MFVSGLRFIRDQDLKFNANWLAFYITQRAQSNLAVDNKGLKKVNY